MGTDPTAVFLDIHRFRVKGPHLFSLVDFYDNGLLIRIEGLHQVLLHALLCAGTDFDDVTPAIVIGSLDEKRNVPFVEY